MNDEAPQLLYPRLPAASGREILASRVGRSPAELVAEGAVSHASAAPSPTGGHAVGERGLEHLQSCVRDVAEEAGFPAPLIRGSEQTFDRPCGRMLYSEMGIVPADAAEEGVWSFISVVLLPEIGPWRFPQQADDRILGHRRNVFRRLWWRAWSLGADLDAAPLGCQPLGEDEFVQIMERPTLGGNRRIARALRDGLWRAELDGLTVARSELMRQMARRLRAVRSHIALDALDEPQLRALVDRVAAESLHSLS